MLRAGEGARADVSRVGCNRGLDGGTKLAIALDEFRHPRGEPEHVLEHQDLAIAGDASADADGRDFDGSRDAAGERLGYRLDHDRKGARLRDRPRIILDRSPIRLAATLSAERADGVDRLWREADMAHGRHAALDQKGDGLGHAAAALELDRSAAGLLHHPRSRPECL